MGAASSWPQAGVLDSQSPDDPSQFSDLHGFNLMHIQQTVHDIQSRNLLMSLAGLMEAGISADDTARVGGLILLEADSALKAQANAQPGSIVLLE